MKELIAYKFLKKHFKSECKVADWLEKAGIETGDFELKDRDRYWKYQVAEPLDGAEEDERPQGFGVFAVFAALPEISRRSWDAVDKAKLPPECFLVVGDPDLKATWKLPVYEGAGGTDPDTGMYRERGLLNVNALKAAWAAIKGARTGEPMRVPAEVRSKVESWLEALGIGERGGGETKREHEKKMETFDIKGVEIFKSGEWTDSGGATTGYTEKDIADMAAAMQELRSVFEPPIKIGHNESQKLKSDEMPAFGWLKNFRAKAGILICDFVGVPKTVYELIKSGAYKKRSAEIWSDYYDESLKKKFKHVIAGIALIGAKLPALGSLKDVRNLFDADEKTLVFTYSCDSPNGGITCYEMESDKKEEKGGEIDMTAEELQKKVDELQAQIDELKETIAAVEGAKEELSKKAESLEQESKKKEETISAMAKEREEKAEASRREFMVSIGKKVEPKHNETVMQILQLADKSEAKLKYSADGKETEIPLGDGVRAFFAGLPDHPAFEEHGEKRKEDPDKKDKTDTEIAKYCADHKLDIDNPEHYRRACLAVMKYEKPSRIYDGETENEEAE